MTSLEISSPISPLKVKMVVLFPSQVHLVESLRKMVPFFNVIVVKGDARCGKHTGVSHFFAELNIIPIEFDINEMIQGVPPAREISAHDLSSYLMTLSQRANELGGGMESTLESLNIGSDSSSESSMSKPRNKRSRIEKDPNTGEKVQGTKEPVKAPYVYIYIRRLDQIQELLCDYNSKTRNLPKILFHRWVEKLHEHVRIIVTCADPHKIELREAWICDFSVTSEDVRSLVSTVTTKGNKRDISKKDVDKIIAFMKKPLPGPVISSLRYSLGMTPKNRSTFPLYEETYVKLAGSPLDIEKDVAMPTENVDLIGMELILDEIRTNVILPIELNRNDVPVKKGLVLYGPSGTGKTSIGRWLAHQLKGRFYLLGGECGVCGPGFIDVLEDTLAMASENTPAVVFIDDVDMLFAQPDSYRAFLTMLDGLDAKKRNNICVVVTCMNLQNIYASLLRGGRLEMCLRTKLPNSDCIAKLVKIGLDKIVRVSREVLNTNLSYTENLVSSLTIRMTGWNCADINRAIDDVLRLILARKGTDLSTLFETTINQIRSQYEQCSREERYSKGDDDQPMYYS